MKPSAILADTPITKLKETIGLILDDLDERITPKQIIQRVGIECTREERDFLDELKGGIQKIKSGEGDIYQSKDKSILFKQSEFRTLLHRVFK